MRVDKEHWEERMRPAALLGPVTAWLSCQGFGESLPQIPGRDRRCMLPPCGTLLTSSTVSRYLLPFSS